MADRTSAEVFGNVFKILAENPDERGKEIALKIWPQINGYDFNEYQMESDDALIELGLAKTVKEGGFDVILYANSKGVFEDESN